MENAEAWRGTSGLHPPSAPSSLSSHARNCYCKSPFWADTEAKPGSAPNPRVRNVSHFAGAWVHPQTPHPVFLHVPELLRPKAEQQESLSPGVLGKLRHKNLCFSIRSEVTKQENIKYPRMRRNLHWQEMDTVGIAHLWEEMDQGDTREASTGQTKLLRQIGKTCSWRISEEAAKPRDLFLSKISD